MSEETSIFDYLKVIIKRKKTVLAVIFFSVIFTFIFTVLAPPIFKGKMLVEIGEIDGIPLEEASVSVARINEIYLSAEAEEVEGYVALKIKKENSGKDDVKSDLQNIFDHLYEHHNTILERRKQEKEEIIDVEKEFLASMKNELEHLENEVKVYKQVISSSYEPATIFLLFNAQKEYESKKRVTLEKELQVKSMEREIERVKETSIVYLNMEQNGKRISVNLILSAILGVFAGCFLVIMKEWWKNEQEV